MSAIIAGGAAGVLESELLKNGEPVDLPAGDKWGWTSPDALVTFEPADPDPTTGVVNLNDIKVLVAGSDTQTEAVIVATVLDADGNPVNNTDGTPESGEITLPVTPEAQVFTVRITQKS